jgi:hypothetical protein
MPEWIAAPLVHSFFQSTKLQDRLKVAAPKGKTLNCKALTCLWTTVKKNTKEHQAVLMKARLNDVGWKTTSGKIRNEQHDGYIEDRSTYLIAANREIINRLPEQFAELNDGCHHLDEQTLDIGDGMFKDCFTSFATSNKDSKPSGTGASVKTKITVHHGDQKIRSTFSML